MTPVSDQTARRIAAALERIASLMEREADRRDPERGRSEPRGHVIPKRGRRAA